ncbi:sensitivity to high expression protein she9 [Mycoemilia scoparia]|uniref:Sensitive to high expression protein 9, mitochondrial n=1 Tax=Mycoemilia scoparia TaxID=417184 RepID=A0A9W7ZTN1_9FUNG|nr:sensitivity to high expression protein she9 [Mycoemilia scoparia]
MVHHSPPVSAIMLINRGYSDGSGSQKFGSENNKKKDRFVDSDLDQNNGSELYNSKDTREPVEEVLKRILEPRKPAIQEPSSTEQSSSDAGDKNSANSGSSTSGETDSNNIDNQDPQQTPKQLTNQIRNIYQLSPKPQPPINLRPTLCQKSKEISISDLTSRILSQHRHNLEQKLQTFLKEWQEFQHKTNSTNYLTRISKSLNYVTGYDNIQDLKQKVEDASLKFQEARKEADTNKHNYEQALLDHATCQRDINNMLQRKNAWTDQDVLQFTSLYKAEHKYEQQQHHAKEAVRRAEKNVDRIYDMLVTTIRERYHEEQLWSDKIRQSSTYVTWAVLCVNVVVLIAVHLYFEPRKRQKIIEGVGQYISEKFDQDGDNGSTQLSDGSGGEIESIKNSIFETDKKVDEIKNSLNQVSSILNSFIITNDDDTAAADIINQQQKKQTLDQTEMADLVRDMLNDTLNENNDILLDQAQQPQESIEATNLSITKKISNSIVPPFIKSLFKNRDNDEMTVFVANAAIVGAITGSLVSWILNNH